MSKKLPPGVLSISTPKLAHCALGPNRINTNKSNIFKEYTAMAMHSTDILTDSNKTECAQF